MEEKINNIIDTWWENNRINCKSGYDENVIMNRKDIQELKRLIKNHAFMDDDVSLAKETEGGK